jgi:hypothetical protein
MWVVRLSDGVQGTWGINGGFQPMEEMVEASRQQNKHPSAAAQQPSAIAIPGTGGNPSWEGYTAPVTYEQLAYEGSGYEA